MGKGRTSNSVSDREEELQECTPPTVFLSSEVFLFDHKASGVSMERQRAGACTLKMPRLVTSQ